MTSNYKKKRPIVTTQELFDEAIKAETNRVYDKIGADISAQILALALVNLEINYGWKRDRLRAFVNNIHATADLACNIDVFGKTVDVRQFVEHLKNKYGIDVHQEVKKM